MAFKHGDIVVWKAEFAQSEDERTRPLVVLEPADDGRCYRSCGVSAPRLA